MKEDMFSHLQYNYERNPVTIPCKNCVTLAVCRHKEYLDLFLDCKLISQFVPSYRKTRDYRHNEKIAELYNTLQSTKWFLSIDGYILSSHRHNRDMMESVISTGRECSQ